MKLDPVIIRTLSLNESVTSVAKHGGSGFATTAKITTQSEDGGQKHFFLKTGKGKESEVMFKGEHASLNAIHDIVPSLCPASLATAMLEDHSGAFLVTEFLDLNPFSSSSKEKGSGLSLAAKLAKLHTTPAPVPEGYSKPVFGFSVTTCCGDTAQPNEYRESWAQFYTDERLLAILGKNERTNGTDNELRSIVEHTADVVVPKLLGDHHLNNGTGITPVVIHGDLWSGNKGRARIGGRGGIEDIIYDPSAYYAHSECELGIMKMFGGFGGAFMNEYHRHCPKTEPVSEYEDRVSLYEL